MREREQPWSDEPEQHGRVLVLTDNPIARSIAVIASTAGRTVLVESADDGGPGLDAQPGDAVVLCDHDAPDAPAVLRAALASEAVYVAMMASRRRAEGSSPSSSPRASTSAGCTFRPGTTSVARRRARSPCRCGA